MKPEQIIQAVCKALELDVEIVICEKCVKSHSYCFTQNYVDARHIICYLIRKIHYKDYSYRAISEMLGKTLKNGTGIHSFSLYGEWICGERLKNKDKAFIEKFEKCNIATKPLVLPMTKPHK